MEKSRNAIKSQCITVYCMFICNLFVSCVFCICVKLCVDVMFGIRYFMCNVVNFSSILCICLSVCAFVSLSVYKSFLPICPSVIHPSSVYLSIYPSISVFNPSICQSPSAQIVFPHFFATTFFVRIPIFLLI